MRNRTAKQNPLLLRLAIRHYLAPRKGKPPLFTFMSLDSDNEPYPVAEVLAVLNERIKALEALEYPTETDSTALMIATKQRAKLIIVAERMRTPPKR